MRRFHTLGFSTALAVSLAVTVAPAAEIDCGPQPTLACLAPHILAIARALPESDDWRTPNAPPALSSQRKAMLRFAEEELAPASPEEALRWFSDESPEPTHWEDIAAIARVGRFDRALALAEEADLPLRRVGGLIEVAGSLAAAGQKARAAALLRRVEPDLTDDSVDDSWAPVLRDWMGRYWLVLGEVDRAIPRLSGESCLQLAKKYPAAAVRLRRQAWQLAERGDPLTSWEMIAKDARERGDTTAAAAADRRAGADMGEAARRTSADDSPADQDSAYSATVLATRLLDAGRTDEAKQVMDRWRAWAAGKYAGNLANVIRPVVPILVRLGRDREAEEAARMVADSMTRTMLFADAAARAHELGRPEVTARWEAEAIRMAEAMANEVFASTQQRDQALARMASLRNQRGDFWGALSLLAQIPSDTSANTVSLIESAIDRGNGAAAMPMIERLETAARRRAAPSLLLSVAGLWQRAGRNDTARTVLADALAPKENSSDAKLDLTKAAQLIWQLDRDLDAIQARLDAVASERDRATLWEARFSIALANAPGDAVRIAGDVANPLQRLQALERIVGKIVEDEYRRNAQ